MTEREVILLVVRPVRSRHEGVGEYATALADALAQQGCPTRVSREISRWGWRGLTQLLRACRQARAGTVVLQFSPFMYGRRGVCLYLAGWLAAVRLLSRARVVVTFHELYNGWGRHPLTAGVSLVHRLHCFAVGLLAHAVVFTTGRRAALGRRWFFWKPRRVHGVPVGSNIPCVAAGARSAGAPPYQISTFGLLQTGVCFEELVQALAGLVHEDGVNARLRLIGDWTAADPRRKQRLDELVGALRLADHVQWSGPQPAEVVSRLLAASDLYVCYRTDGPTTRSGTLAAALAHGVPVLANRAAELDPVFAGNEAVQLFADAIDLRRQCRELLADAARRAELGRRGREFYLAELTWERIAQQYADIGLVGAASRHDSVSPVAPIAESELPL
jgi:glycosyltransferase involved in cell wall biosynthesis